MSYNKMTIMGNLGAEPEIKQVPSGATVADFSVAVNDRYRNQAGDLVETLTWYRVSCWNKLAEVVGAYLHKGNPVYIEGPLTPRVYTANDGSRKMSLDIRASTMKMLGGRRPEAETSGDGEGAETVLETETLETAVSPG